MSTNDKTFVTYIVELGTYIILNVANNVQTQRNPEVYLR